MKEHLQGQKFADDDKVMETVQSWLKATPKSFFLEGIRKLVDRWTKCGPTYPRINNSCLDTEVGTILYPETDNEK